MRVRDRWRRHRGVAASGHPAEDHEEPHQGQPCNGDQDEEHWVVLVLYAAVLVLYR
jgi:hypothetical protein